MQVYYVYESQLAARGWLDSSGVAPPSWFDRELADPMVQAPFFLNINEIYMPEVRYEVIAPFFVNESEFYSPHVFNVRASDVHMLKNEVRRRYMLKREPPR